ncbi:hypothetical protein ACJ73_09375 [Blastomyces percursus]|uniref:Uncharacterized protein n=1 Tax=Blastomyces percursus TaxID=1658174 RepID=A0A1J9P786_9EURO|nr:hypothetical protein ACJ73_09375 [Blastomyces percursus]
MAKEATEQLGKSSSGHRRRSNRSDWHEFHTADCNGNAPRASCPARQRTVAPDDRAANHPTPSPTQPQYQPQSSAFRDFKDEFGHIDLKTTNKLAGDSNYTTWRREIEAKAILIQASDLLKNLEEGSGNCQGDDAKIWRYKESKLWEYIWNSMKPEPQTLAQSKSRQETEGSTKMGRAAALWQALELGYQPHWADLQAQFYAKIASISIDQYEKDITKYAKAWELWNRPMQLSTKFEFKLCGSLPVQLHYHYPSCHLGQQPS